MSFKRNKLFEKNEKLSSTTLPTNLNEKKRIKENNAYEKINSSQMK